MSSRSGGRPSPVTAETRTQPGLRVGLGLARGAFFRRQQVELVPDLDDAGAAELVDAEFGQHAVHVLGLGIAVGVGDVADVQDDVGREHLLQRGAEGGDQRGRQVGDEAHRVGQDDLAAMRQLR